MTDVKRLLEGSKNVDGWRITEKATVSYELFFVHRKLETVRATDTVATGVTVYVDHDGKKGDSTFSVYQSMTEEDVKRKIDAAASRARLVFNEPYELPQGGEVAASLPTNMDGEDAKALGCRIAQAVFAADTLEGGSVNACEIFIYHDTVKVQNSRGVNKTQSIYRVMIEAIPTFTDGAGSVELYEDLRFTAFDAEKVTAQIAARMREVRDRARAVKPHTSMNINVVLRPPEISQLLNELAQDLNYAAVYSHANLHKLGDDLQPGGTGDKLTVTMKGVVEGSERSACFDSDGAALHDTCVLKEGVVRSYFGAGRFGQYLGVKTPSGQLPCLQAAAGTLTEAQLREAPYMECASLSGLQLDLYNDYIGGEIRLAYCFDGEKSVPVTGVTMSGKLSDVLATLRLSEKTTVEGAYEGPDKLLMRGMTVL